MENFLDKHKEMEKKADEKLEELKVEDVKKQTILGDVAKSELFPNKPILHETEHNILNSPTPTPKQNKTMEVKKVDYNQLKTQIKHTLEKTKESEKIALEAKEEALRQEGVLRFVESLEARGMLIVEGQ